MGLHIIKNKKRENYSIYRFNANYRFPIIENIPSKPLANVILNLKNKEEEKLRKKIKIFENNNNFMY